MTTEYLLEVNGLTVRSGNDFLLKDISFTILKNECWAIIGETGSGKSTLLQSIKNYKSHPGIFGFCKEKEPKISLIKHQEKIKDRTGNSQLYYQQRFNSVDKDRTEPAKECLSGIKINSTDSQVIDQLNIRKLLEQPVVQLSNGEHKKLQLARALLEGADWILLDDAFVGLDCMARQLIKDMLQHAIDHDVKILLVTTTDIPEFVTHIAEFKNGILTSVRTRKKYFSSKTPKTTCRKDIDLSSFNIPAQNEEFKNVVKLDQVKVIYSGKKILDNISWQVKKSERWNISGPNGSGKSTLLSLITGDNPQAFANDIHLFDRKRGSGETIWQIKKKIGFVSPELHYYFDRSSTVHDVVASGLFDTIGLFRKLSPHHKKAVNEILEIFEISAFETKLLGTLSQGYQRLALLARAMIKNPPLLILDEPTQGLDNELAQHFIDFIDKITVELNKTLINVTHEMHRIPACVTHQLKMNEGKIIEIDLYHGKENNSHTGRWNRA